jgi:plasmid maintenance system antidote protein VapI
MNFKEKINEKGLKKKKVAEMLGITKEHLSRVLNSKSNLTIELEERLRKVLQ